MMAGSSHHSFSKCLSAASVDERVCGGATKGTLFGGSALRNLRVLTEEKTETAPPG